MSMTNKKMVVVGDGFCGKTALLFAFTQDKFDEENYEPTVFETMCVHVDIGRRTASTAWQLSCDRVNLCLWDTAGQDDYDRLRPLSYPDTDVVLLCYSVDSLSSFKNIKEKWVPELGHFCYGVPFLLVANKKDLRERVFNSQNQKEGTLSDDVSSTTAPISSPAKPPTSPTSGASPAISKTSGTTFGPPMITWEEGQNLAKDIDAHAFFECSAKTRENVREVFVEAVKASLKSRRSLKRGTRRCCLL